MGPVIDRRIVAAVVLLASALSGCASGPRALWRASASRGGHTDTPLGLPKPSSTIATHSKEAFGSFPEIERRRLERFAGVEIPSSEIERILRELGYEPEQVEPDSWNVRVPSWRYYDCEAVRYEDPPAVWEADSYEEVMRHFG